MPEIIPFFDEVLHLAEPLDQPFIIEFLLETGSVLGWMRIGAGSGVQARNGRSRSQIVLFWMYYPSVRVRKNLGGDLMKTGVSVTSLRSELRTESNRLTTSLMAGHGLGLTVIGGFLWAGWVGMAQSQPETGLRLLDSLRPGIMLWALFVTGFILASVSHLIRLFGLSTLLDHKPGSPASKMRKGRRIFWKASNAVIDTFKLWSGISLVMALALVSVMAGASVVVANEHRVETRLQANAPLTARPVAPDAEPSIGATARAAKE